MLVVLIAEFPYETKARARDVAGLAAHETVGGILTQERVGAFNDSGFALFGGEKVAVMQYGLTDFFLRQRGASDLNEFISC